MTCQHCTDYEQLGREINARDFEAVFRIKDGTVEVVDNVYAPTVMHDPVTDVVRHRHRRRISRRGDRERRMGHRLPDRGLGPWKPANTAST
jgi:hypothetical protein